MDIYKTAFWETAPSTKLSNHNIYLWQNRREIKAIGDLGQKGSCLTVQMCGAGKH